METQLKWFTKSFTTNLSQRVRRLLTIRLGLLTNLELWHLC